MYPRDSLPSIEWGSLWCGSVVKLSLRLVGAAVECVLGAIYIRCCAPQGKKEVLTRGVVDTAVQQVMQSACLVGCICSSAEQGEGHSH